MQFLDVARLFGWRPERFLISEGIGIKLLYDVFGYSCRSFPDLQTQLCFIGSSVRSLGSGAVLTQKHGLDFWPVPYNSPSTLLTLLLGYSMVMDVPCIAQTRFPLKSVGSWKSRCPANFGLCAFCHFVLDVNNSSRRVPAGPPLSGYPTLCYWLQSSSLLFTGRPIVVVLTFLSNSRHVYWFLLSL